jgi:hypothetical protein
MSYVEDPAARRLGEEPSDEPPEPIGLVTNRSIARADRPRHARLFHTRRERSHLPGSSAGTRLVPAKPS